MTDIQKTETSKQSLAEPRIENGRAMKLAGIEERFNGATSVGIPALWQRFGKFMGNIPGQVGSCAYGAKYDAGNDEFFNYMCAWEVAADAPEVPELQYIKIPVQTYLVFTHSDHVSKIIETCTTIWDKYFPQSKYKAAKGIEFELYDQKFDAKTGLGGLELWIPIQQ